MPAPKTELENFLSYGIDERNRRIYFGSPIDSAHYEDDITEFTKVSVEAAIRALERMATDYPKVPIEIHMNSFGGDPYSMLALYDVIQASDCQIKFYGKGAIMSSAVWLMAGCDERYLYPNTTIMIHDGWDDPGKQACADQDIYREEQNRLKSRLHDIFADNSRISKSFWEELCKRDLYLTAEETIFLGLADEIVHPKKRGNFRKKRQHHLNQPIDKRKITKVLEKLSKRIQMPTNITITINEPKIEPIDDNLTIEAKPLAIPEEPIKE